MLHDSVEILNGPNHPLMIEIFI